MDRELSAGHTSTAMPRRDSVVPATEDLATAELQTDGPDFPRQAPAKDEVQADGSHTNENPEIDYGTQTTVYQGPAAKSTSIQSDGVFENSSQTSSLQPLHTSTTTNGRTSDIKASMPPPAAPASMLWSLQPLADRVKFEGDQLSEPSVIGRLVSLCVILFRQGCGAEARKLGQFTVDLIGQEAWHEWLPTYMNAAPRPDDREQVFTLLHEAVIFMKHVDQTSSAFLDGMVYVWT